MNVDELLKKTEKLAKENGTDPKAALKRVKQNATLWSASACLGYLIQASKEIGQSNAEIIKLLTACSSSLEKITPAQAEKIFNKFMGYEEK